MTSAELIRELQAARPVAGDALRARVEAIAAQEPQRRRSSFARISLRRMSTVALPATAAVALAAAGALGLARSGENGRVALAHGTTVERSYATGAGTAQDQAARSALESQKVPSASAGAAPAVGPTVGRPQSYRAQLTLEVADTDALSEATQRALSIVRSLGGYAVSVSFDAPNETGGAALVLRVPTAKVQDAVVRLSQLGTIVGQQVQIDDLGEQVDQLEQRERSLREQIARLTARLQQQGLDNETRAALEARRSAARRELAEVRQAHAAVNREARLATISLALRTKADAGAAKPSSRIDRALGEAANVLAWEGIVLLYAVVVAGPFALLGSTLWVGTKVRRRREEDRLLAAS
jgi:uncharacterized protein DUF4349